VEFSVFLAECRFQKFNEVTGQLLRYGATLSIPRNQAIFDGFLTLEFFSFIYFGAIAMPYPPTKRKIANSDVSSYSNIVSPTYSTRLAARCWSIRRRTAW